MFREVKTNPILFLSDKTDFPAHIHRDIEIAFALRGSFTAFSEGKKYDVKKGMFFIAFPNRIHYYQNSDRSGEYVIMIFKPNIIAQSSGINENLVSAYPVGDFNDNYDRIANMLRDFAGSFAQEEANIQSTFINLIFLLIAQKIKFCPSDFKSDKTEKIISYCERHFTEDIGIPQIAKDLSISRSYISYIFSHKLLINFREYINSLRLEYAASLLETSTMKITNIAEKSGFNNMRSFNRTFRLGKGLTPSEYRKKRQMKYPLQNADHT